MRKQMGRALCAATLIWGVSTPAFAGTGCWDHTQAAAAKLRNLQSKLMVATIRCQASGIDVVASYNDFVRANRTTIQAANGVIKQQFSKVSGSSAQAEYDRFTTALANAFGGDPTDANACAETVRIAIEGVAAGGHVDTLLALADRAGSTPLLPGGHCPIVFAGVSAE